MHNYRPISVISVIAKVFERIMDQCAYLGKTARSFNIGPDEHFGPKMSSSGPILNSSGPILNSSGPILTHRVRYKLIGSDITKTLSGPTADESIVPVITIGPVVTIGPILTLSGPITKNKNNIKEEKLGKKYWIGLWEYRCTREYFAIHFPVYC